MRPVTFAMQGIISIKILTRLITFKNRRVYGSEKSQFIKYLMTSRDPVTPVNFSTSSTSSTHPPEGWEEKWLWNQILVLVSTVNEICSEFAKLASLNLCSHEFKRMNFLSFTCNWSQIWNSIFCDWNFLWEFTHYF